MRMLLFSEWAIIRASIRQYAIVTTIMALVIGMGAVSVDEPATAADVASRVQVGVIPTVTIMLTFFVFFSLFGADEREGWETARLALPVSRRQVVSARYLVMLVVLCVSVVVASVAGAVVGAAFSLALCGEVAFQSPGEVIALCMGLVGVFSAYVAIQMPVFFKWGLAKARPFFNVPALLCLLALFPLLGSVRSTLGERASDPAALVAQLGTGGIDPMSFVIIGAVGLALAAGIFLASLRISQRVYVRRDF